MSWVCRGKRHTSSARPKRLRLNVGQARFRGGWSGGGRSSPSAKTSSRSACAVRTAWRTGKADVAGGAAWAVVNTHIAITGQSVQVLLFCSSGQHGMSAAIDDTSATDDMSVVPAAIMSVMACLDACMAAGAATGATANPTTMAIASNRVMNRRKSHAVFWHGGRGMWKGPHFTFAAGTSSINRAGCGSWHRSGEDFDMFVPDSRRHGPGLPLPS